MRRTVWSILLTLALVVGLIGVFTTSVSASGSDTASYFQQAWCIL